MDTQTIPLIELLAVPCSLRPGYWRAVIRRDGSNSYTSQAAWPTADQAQVQAARVFAGLAQGYRY